MPRDQYPQIPRFMTVADVGAWMGTRVRETYRTKNELLSSAEYRAAYPSIDAIYRREREAATARLAQDGAQALVEAGLKVGNRVAYGAVGSFFNVEVLRGKIVSRKGVPYVALDQPHNGKKSVRWHKGWTAEILPFGTRR